MKGNNEMKKLATLAPLVAILLLAGCATDPSTGDVQVTVPAAAVDFVTNIVQRGAAAWTISRARRMRKE